MGTGRTLNKKPRTRPTKSTGERARRNKVQAKRLVALGVEESEVKKMTAGAIREALRLPKKTAAKAAAAKENA